MTDPTKPGPDADRIAELERELAELEAADAKAKGWGAAASVRAEILKNLYAELARLFNEQPTRRTRAEIGADIDAWHRDIGRFNNATPEERKRYGALRRELAAAPLPEAPSPATSPEPQDVRVTDAMIDAFDVATGNSMWKPMISEGLEAALAQSDAQPNSRIIDRLLFCEDCLRAGVPDEYFGWAGDQPSLGELAQSDAQPDDPDLVAAKEHAARISSEPPIIAVLERYAQSIAMWCDRENVTDQERLSYIANHPVTKKYRARAADRSAPRSDKGGS